MTRDEELASSREGLLDTHPSRPSVDDDTYSSSSDFDLDELDALHDEPKSRLRGGWWPVKREGTRRERRAKKDATHAAKSRRKGGCLRSKTCWIITAVLVSALIILIVSASWIFGWYAPEDGLSPPWYPSPQGGTLESWKESYDKASKMVAEMTLVEKVNITTGTGWATNLCVGNTGPAVNVGFPMLCLQDGPLGIRFADNATAWPAGITVGATWNRDLMYKRGKALGLEHRLKGVNILLGPSMGPLGRMPAGGRNWEGFGPDPVLAGVAAAQTIKGIQEEGVMATAKHFILNEQEHYRQPWAWGLPNALSANIDDRTLHELYLWPFADSVRAGVASIMCSYQMVNNSYACGNSKLMNGILKDELGFQGFVQSDWLAQRSGVASALAGLDMSMPGDGEFWNDRNPFWGVKLTEAVLNGSVPLERIDDMATRIVAAWYQLKQDDKTRWPAPPPEGDGGPNFSSFTYDEIGKVHPDTGDETTDVVNEFIDVQGAGDDFHGRLAQQVAAEGTVLVKNVDNFLPLRPEGPPRDPPNSRYRVGVYGEDAATNPAGPNACEDRNCNVGTLAMGWGSGAVEFPFLTAPIDALQSNFNHQVVDISLTATNDLREDVVKEIPTQDLCIAFITSDAGEGFTSWHGITDRPDLNPQKGGDELVQRVADNCKQTIVVVHAVGPVVLERFADHPKVKAILLANLPGEESGNALADVLFGHVDASGRLPYTIGKNLKDYGPGGQIISKPKVPNLVTPQQDFDEGLLIDYRYFDAKTITPRYEFGFGLSYTTFTFSNLVLTELRPKTPFALPRPSSTIEPPSYSTDIPDASNATWPEDFPRIDRYIYPYLDNASVTTSANYPYPTGYFNPQKPSKAGGSEGGNPALYEIHLSVSVDVTNTGDRKGKQVVQVYVSFPRTVDQSTGQEIDFPVKVLRGFEKIEIDKGAKQTVRIDLTRRDLSFWSVGRQDWIMPTDGKIKIWVGASSRDLPLSEEW